jgi:S1-C subfamily serine protease
VYVALLAPADSPRWPGLEWQLPPSADVAPGSFLFTADAAVAGLVVDHGGGRGLVPAATVAERLLNRPPVVRAYVGIDVQPLTSSLAKATGATGGLIVTWVDPAGPAAGALDAGEVIETANGAVMETRDHWDVQIARLAAAQTLTIGVHAAAGDRQVSLVATPVPAMDPASLGVTLRAVPGIGAEVVRVNPGSAGDRGGLRAGDVVTRAASTAAPTPAQLRRAFAVAGERPLVVAFTRGATRHVTALEK